jgi:hypothetical protein
MNTFEAPSSTGPDGFREAMRPTVEAIRDLTEAIRDAPERHGSLPSAESVAMAEINAQAQSYQKLSDWEAPLGDTHTFGAMTLLAASDYAWTFAEAFTGSRAPVYGHLVVARSALEAAVVSNWLNDPRVSPLDRIKRGLTEQLYSAKELVRLKIDEKAKVRVAYWKTVATRFGWAVAEANGKPVIDGTKRPSVPLGINELLLGDDQQGGLGRVQWSYLSAVSHVTWYGLRQAIIELPKEQSISGHSLAGVGTESRAVYSQALCVLKALRRAATARMVLMGWVDQSWESACRASAAHERVLLASIAPPPSGD